MATIPLFSALRIDRHPQHAATKYAYDNNNTQPKGMTPGSGYQPKATKSSHALAAVEIGEGAQPTPRALKRYSEVFEAHPAQFACASARGEQVQMTQLLGLEQAAPPIGFFHYKNTTASLVQNRIKTWSVKPVQIARWSPRSRATITMKRRRKSG